MRKFAVYMSPHTKGNEPLHIIEADFFERAPHGSGINFYRHFGWKKCLVAYMYYTNYDILEVKG